MPPKEVDKKRSINTYESKCLGLIGEADDFASTNTGGLTNTGMERAKMHIKRINDQFSRMETRWEDDFKAKLEAEDPTLHDELEKRVIEVGTKVGKSIDVLYQLMDKPVITSSTSASAAKSLKMEVSFKPTVLAASSNLEEFNAWHSSFVAHHDQNKAFLQASTQEIRRVFLTSLIDPKLQDAMSTDETLSMETPIVGEEDSLLAWLRAYLLRHLPLFIRRYQYSICKQKPRESFGDFWTRKLIKAKECELDKVKREDIEVTELICGINDPKLRDEILKLKVPKLVDLVAMGERFDTAAKLQKNNFEDTKVNKTTSDYKKGKNKDWQQQRGRDQSRGRD